MRTDLKEIKKLAETIRKFRARGFDDDFIGHILGKSVETIHEIENIAAGQES